MRGVAVGGHHGSGETIDYVTIVLGKEMFGLPIDRVHDVFIATNLTDEPDRHVAPVGRVVRQAEAAAQADRGDDPAAQVEHQVGEVMKLAEDTYEPNPVHMDARWRGVSKGVHRPSSPRLPGTVRRRWRGGPRQRRAPHRRRGR
jgi:purine-binding chemotaxis protein CheW